MSSRNFKILFLFFCLFLSCTIDHGLEPIRSKIGGTVQFIGAQNPFITDEVRVAVVPQFPPRTINELLFSDIIWANRDTLPADPRPWEIYLPPGSYDIVAVIWKANNQSWNISDIIGVYGGTFIGDQLIPPFPFRPIVLPSNDSVIDTLHVVANLDRVNRDTLIQGTIYFLGSWPSNTGVVGIGAFSEVPQKGNLLDYFFKNVSLDYSIPPFVSSYGYRLRVRSTQWIRYVAVLWIDNAFDLSSMREIGFYRDFSDSTQPGEIQSKTGPYQGIDITVNFSE